jgi:hypothetical protein
MATRGSFSIKKNTILPVDHHGDHKVEIGDAKWPLRGIFWTTKVFNVKMTHLPLQHHCYCRMSPIVSILSEHGAWY